MKKYIEKQLSEILGRLYGSGQIEVMPSIEVSKPEPTFGDYSTNIALRLSKILKTSPKIVAQSFISELKSLDTHGDFLDITEEGGFINFKLSKTNLLKNMQAVLEHGQSYGSSLSGDSKKVLVEYFQPNVAKPLHLGHISNAVVGDALFSQAHLHAEYGGVFCVHAKDAGNEREREEGNRHRREYLHDLVLA